jgi:dimethylargininase
MTPNGALIGKFRYYERKGEEEQVTTTLEREGYPIIGLISKGALEGGDCFYIDEKTVAIGHGNRSTLAGVEEAGAHLKRQGIEVLTVELYAR